MDVHDIDLPWQTRIDESVDPFDLKPEFKEKDPILDQPPDSDKEPDDVDWDICPDLPMKERRIWKRMLRKYLKIFAGPTKRLEKVDSRFDMKIDANISEIRSQQSYRIFPRKRKLIREAMRKLKELEIIQSSTSEIASPVVVIMQKEKPRFYLDLREINSKTKIDKYAIPRQDTIFQTLAGAIFFSLLDANKGYHQIDLDELSRMLTAFVMEDEFWEFIRVPFGLKNAPTHFQRTIDRILGSFRFDFALAFIDDIVVFSKSFDAHLRHVELVLDALLKIGMIIDEAKCHFCYKSIELLGHRVSRFGLSTQTEKIAAIVALPFPRTIGQAMEILGTFNYYREFIDRYAEIARPLTQGLAGPKKKVIRRNRNSPRPANLLPPRKKPSLKDLSTDDDEHRGSSTFNKSATTSKPKIDPKETARRRSRLSFPDTPETRTTFAALKHVIIHAPILIYADFLKEFILYCDASRKGIVDSLHQVSDLDGKEHPILFISRSLKPAETRYASIELECLAIV